MLLVPRVVFIYQFHCIYYIGTCICMNISWHLICIFTEEHALAWKCLLDVQCGKEWYNIRHNGALHTFTCYGMGLVFDMAA